jgi:hypothetical protein
MRRRLPCADLVAGSVLSGWRLRTEFDFVRFLEELRAFCDASGARGILHDGAEGIFQYIDSSHGPGSFADEPWPYTP